MLLILLLVPGSFLVLGSYLLYKMKKKVKKIKYRDWNAVNAHFMKSGPMKDRKKEGKKKLCRKNLKAVLRRNKNPS